MCLVDAAQDGAIEDLVSRVEKDIGPIEALLYNLELRSEIERYTIRLTTYFSWDGA